MVGQAQSTDRLYYDVGGASPSGASAALWHGSRAQGLGIAWDIDVSCGNFDMGATVSNLLNGVTNDFQNLMGNVVQSAIKAGLSTMCQRQ